MSEPGIDNVEFDKIMLTIDNPVKHDLSLSLVELTIPIWEDYAKDPEKLTYVDGVGGSYRIVYADTSGNIYSLEKDIVRKTLQVIEEEKLKPGTQIMDMQVYCDKLKAHSAAIDIWDDPQPLDVELTILATHNLLQLHQGKFKGLEEKNLNLIIWQAALALVESKLKTIDEIMKLLRSSAHNGNPVQPDQAPNGR